MVCLEKAAAYKDRTKQICTDPAILSYIFTPNLKGSRLGNTRMRDFKGRFVLNYSFALLEQLENYLDEKPGTIFARPELKNLATKAGSAVAYWLSVRPTHPELAKLALDHVKLPASTAALERVFSMWKFVHSKLRNRLTPDRSEKLAFIYHTLKMAEVEKVKEKKRLALAEQN